MAVSRVACSSAHAEQILDISFRVDANTVRQFASVVVVVASALAAQSSKDASCRLGTVIALAANQPDFMI